jgi:hypothetical protein
MISTIALSSSFEPKTSMRNSRFLPLAFITSLADLNPASASFPYSSSPSSSLNSTISISSSWISNFFSSLITSISYPVNCVANLIFCPLLPMISEACSSSAHTFALLVCLSISTLVTFPGAIFVVQFSYYSMDPYAFHTNAGADSINSVIM